MADATIAAVTPGIEVVATTLEVAFELARRKLSEQYAAECYARLPYGDAYGGAYQLTFLSATHLYEPWVHDGDGRIVWRFRVDKA
jgi:hypothetical protein